MKFCCLFWLVMGLVRILLKNCCWFGSKGLIWCLMLDCCLCWFVRFLCLLGLIVGCWCINGMCLEVYFD